MKSQKRRNLKAVANLNKLDVKKRRQLLGGRGTIVGVNAESKYCDCVVENFAIQHRVGDSQQFYLTMDLRDAVAVYHMNTILEGDTNWGRDGRQVHMTSAKFKGIIELANSNPSVQPEYPVVRLWMVLDRYLDSSIPDTTKVLDYNVVGAGKTHIRMGTQLMRNMDFIDRYTILDTVEIRCWSDTWQEPTGILAWGSPDSYWTFELEAKLDLVAHYSFAGASGVPNTNGIFLMAASSSSLEDTFLSGNGRIRFHDMI